MRHRSCMKFTLSIIFILILSVGIINIDKGTELGRKELLLQSKDVLAEFGLTESSVDVPVGTKKVVKKVVVTNIPKKVIPKKVIPIVVKKTTLSRGGYVEEPRARKVEQKRVENRINWINFECTYYGSTGNRTASGIRPRSGIIASNNFDLGTDIHLEGFGNVSVQDTGSRSCLKQIGSNTYVVDIYVEQRDGESWNRYQQRMLNLGRTRVRGYIIR